MRRVTEQAQDTMKNDFIKTQSLRLREKLSAEFKRHATLLELHKAPETSQERRRKKKKKNHKALLKFLIIMQMPFYSILSLSLFPLWPYVLWLMLGLQKEAQPGHMQIPPSGDQTAQADHHTQDTLQALRCGQTSPLTCVKLPASSQGGNLCTCLSLWDRRVPVLKSTKAI